MCKSKTATVSEIRSDSPLPSISSKYEDRCRENEDSPNENPSEALNKLKAQNLNRIKIGHVNINSLRNKFEVLKGIIKGKLDILMISETKIDESFPLGQFQIDGYVCYRKDRNDKGGGIILFVREDIPSKLLPFDSGIDMEHMFVEINLRKKKWLISCSYNPHTKFIEQHLCHLGKGLDSLSSKFENFILLGDFNAEVTNSFMANFCETYNVSSLIKKPTCFKNPENPTCIDLILTNRKKSFQNSKLIETGLSDFHKLTVTVLKTFFMKQEPKIIKYRDFSKFNNQAFRDELYGELYLNNTLKNISFDNFQNISANIFERHAPIKEKYIRNNQSHFITKDIRKAIMTRTRLKNKFRKEDTEENKKAYNKQRNYCLKLVRKTKKDFYNNLDVKKITDNKQFWKTVKPFFSNKVINNEKITLIENEEVISDDQSIANKFSNFYASVVENLGIENENMKLNDEDIETVVENFKNHPSILKIKEHYNSDSKFSFSPVNVTDVLKEIDALDASKAHQERDIPVKILKKNRDIFADFIKKDFNYGILNDMFPNHLKESEVKPVFKKKSRTEVENYRPVSILPTISKIYERLIHKQLSTFFEPILSKFQCGFRKGHSTEHCLLVMIEKWKKCLDEKGVCAALLTDLSKAFDCLPHNLLLAKLHAYGVDKPALKYIKDYLHHRKQKVKINNTSSVWTDIFFGVPQGSILGPLIFNIFICDLFLFFPDINIVGYADDNTPYSLGKTEDQVINEIKQASEKIFSWFQDNYMKINPEKFHLLMSTTKDLQIDICNESIANSHKEKLLGVIIDNNLSFEEHVENLCKKASQKINALARLASYMNFEQRKLILNSFITSHFSYCSLVWMFHSRRLNNKINALHERALRIIYQDYKSSFSELLNKDNSRTVHQRNLQKLVTELFKVKIGEAPEIMNEIFQIEERPYNFRNDVFVKRHNVRTVRYGTETVSFLAPKLWEMIPEDCKKETSLITFKEKIKNWIPDNCPCRICKKYVQNLGFL